jgi:hypothetical protein
MKEKKYKLKCTYCERGVLQEPTYFFLCDRCKSKEEKGRPAFHVDDDRKYL